MRASIRRDKSATAGEITLSCSALPYAADQDCITAAHNAGLASALVILDKISGQGWATGKEMENYRAVP